MKDRIVRKSMVFGIIILFLGISIYPISAIDITKKILNTVNNGNTLYVGGSGPGNYTYIQDAIDDASDGDTVFVYDDNSPYYGRIFVHTSINLVGENRKTTVIDGHGGDVVCINADGVNISGFTLVSWGGNWLCAGVSIDSNYNTITGNTITYNLYGILIQYSSNYNNITSNLIKDNERGIYLSSSSNNTIFKNNFIGNKRHAFFENCKNVWKQNFWNRPRIFPKLIFGKNEIGPIKILCINIDWHPAKLPYIIGEYSRYE